MRILYKKCPLCGETGFNRDLVVNCTEHPLWDDRLPPNMVWMECGYCEHEFTEGFWTEEAERIIFDKVQPAQRLGGDNPEIARMVASNIITFVGHTMGRWLDVGFGSGALLLTVCELGFYPFGIDRRLETVKLLEAAGVEAHCGSIETVDDQLFDVISMADVLEHVPFPREALKRAHSLLKTNGRLFISCPNRDSYIWQVWENNPYYAEIEHYHNFTRKRLCSLLTGMGFRPLRYRVSERYRACIEILAEKN